MEEKTLNKRGPAPKGRQLRYLLVVDPDVNERFTMSLILQRFGYTVCAAGSVREGIEFQCVAPPDAIFIETGAAGADLMSQLRDDARFRSAPVVLVADQAGREQQEQARRGGLAGLLGKPLDPAEVFLIIQKVVERGLRRNIRIATALPASLEDGAVVQEGYVTVLSNYGMFFRTLEPRVPDDRVRVSFPVWGREVTVDAVVLYAVSFEDGPFREPGMGMKFVNIGPEYSGLIRAYIHEHILEGLSLPHAYGDSPAGVA